MRFSNSSFVHHSNQPGPLTNGLRYFRFWFSFRRDIRILGSEKLEYLGENETKNENILTHWGVENLVGLSL